MIHVTRPDILDEVEVKVEASKELFSDEIKEMEKLHVISMGSVRTRIFDINDSLKQLRENDNVIQKNCKAEFYLCRRLG